MSEPWLTDPMYGGMSPRSARRSYEAWIRNGKQVATAGTDKPASDAEIAVFKRQIEVQLSEYADAIKAAAAWQQNYKKRHKRKGFHCLERT